jgi:acetoin:2,6-dichlorophenolindophenol oxidoreductase subunit alpha
LHLAVVLRLPAIFIFENNQYGESTGWRYAAGGGDIAARAAGFGLPSVQVDGDDFFAVYEAAGEAVARARGGEGPSAIEVSTVRFFGHHSGDPQRYRSREAVLKLREERDCIKNFRTRVTEAGLLERGELDSLDAEIAALIERAVTQARAAPAPEDAALLADVYVSY